MSAILPIWQQVLSDEGRKKFGFKIGPTLPFLIGVYHYLGKLSDEDLHSSICLRKIFEDIFEVGEGIVGITYCNTIDAMVIRNATLAIHNPITSDNSEDKIKEIWEMYGKYIISQKFSCDNTDNSWREFDETTEIPNIKTIKI